jgi:photosystem II stability/assembly factor-like uncharacterized protein
LLAAVVALAGCGGGASAEKDTGFSRVDPDGDPPYVGSLSADPGDGTLYLATNRGLFTIRKGSREARKVTGTLRTDGGSGRVSAALVVRPTAAGRLLASGHPAGGGDLPEALGLISSEDGGRTWSSLSELGTADFHAIELSRDRLVASMYGQAQVYVSRDGGRTFQSRAAPLALVDLEVDPGDPERWVASAENGLYTSADEGRTWRQRDPTPNSRFAWEAADALYRIDPGGPVQRSRDGGTKWEKVGTTGGEPQALAVAGGVLYAALLDGSIHESRDGGRSWTERLAAG